jgi:hypothetical protein
VRSVPLWRVGAGILVLAGLVILIAMFAPIYLHNMELQNFVTDIAERPDSASKSDDLLRTWVLDKAHDLQLPIRGDNVKIQHKPQGMRIDVRYFVRVDLPGYTVDLHFYPGAGSR